MPYLQGLSLVSLGRYEDAGHAFDAALALNKTDPEIWYEKGLVLANLGKSGICNISL